MTAPDGVASTRDTEEVDCVFDPIDTTTIFPNVRGLIET
jgi:hypothetical protein